MERWDYKSLKQQHGQYRTTTADASTREKEKQYPSFSSTLLDSIYRSIDETSREFSATAAMKSNKQVCSKEEDVANYNRACLIEKWMEKKKLATSGGGEKCWTTTSIVGQKSMADFHRGSTKSTSAKVMINQNLSSSSNSDSSFSGGLSSSEAESNHNNIGRGSTLSDFKFPQKPKPIRTTSHHQSEMSRKKHESSWPNRQAENLQREKNKHESFNNINSRSTSTSTSTSTSNNNNSSATKSKKLTRALKIYNDLKKTRQPISPGGRLAGFINSLFTHGNSKKPNNSISRSTTQFDAKSPYSSNCSSASSFNRSCLNKGSLNSNGAVGEKRSVRFYPISVIVDKDCRPCGQKPLHEDHHRQIVEQQKSRNVDMDMKLVVEAFDGDDDDDVSCTSSDLFELDNLGSIGIDCYREELPVYETTRFDLNRVINKGLIV